MSESVRIVGFIQTFKIERPLTFQSDNSLYILPYK